MSFSATAVVSEPKSDNDKDDKVVQVGSLKTQKDAELFVDQRDFSQLMEFYQQNLASHSDKVLSKLIAYIQPNKDISAQQFYQLYLAISKTHAYVGNHRQAIFTAEQIFPFVSQLSDDQALELETWLMTEFQLVGDYSSAINSGYKALQVAQSLPDVHMQLSVLFELAGIFSYLEKPADAMDMMALAESLRSQLTEPGLIWFFTEKAKWQKANREFFVSGQNIKRAISLSKRLSLGTSVFDGQLFLLELYRLQKQYRQAESLARDMYQRATKTRNRQQQFYLLLELIEHELAQLHTEQAQTYYSAATQLQRFIRSEDVQLKMSWAQARILFQQEKYAQAYRILNTLEQSLKSQPQWLLQAQASTYLNEPLLSQQSYQKLLKLALQQQSKDDFNRRVYSDTLLKNEINQLNVSVAALLERLEQQGLVIESGKQRISVLQSLLSLLAAVAILWLAHNKLGWFRKDVANFQDMEIDCLNLRFLYHKLTRWMEQKQAFSMVMLDVDDFSLINAHKGYSGGNEYLQSVSEKLRQLCYHNCYLVRYEGDRFCILAANFDEQQAYVLAERMRKAVAQITLDGLSITPNLTASCAVVCAKSYQNPETIISDTKLAMSVAKKQGKNQTEIVYID